MAIKWVGQRARRGGHGATAQRAQRPVRDGGRASSSYLVPLLVGINAALAVIVLAIKKKKKIMIPAIASSLIHQDLLEGTARKPPEEFCSTPRPHWYTPDVVCAN